MCIILIIDRINNQNVTIELDKSHLLCALTTIRWKIIIKSDADGITFSIYIKPIVIEDILKIKHSMMMMM